jgi:hypothetical protein
MASRVCAAGSSFDFEDACVRAVWAVAVPCSITLALVLSAVLRGLPYPLAFREQWRKFKAPFTELVTLEEAEIILASQNDASSNAEEQERWTPASHKPPVLKNTLISLVSWVQASCWIALGIRALVIGPFNGTQFGYLGWVFMAVPWLYSAIRPIFRPFATVPYDIFALLFSQIFCTTLGFGGLWYEHGVFDKPLPGWEVMAIWGLNVAATFVSFTVVLLMPIALPSKGVDPAMIVREMSILGSPMTISNLQGIKLTPEDYMVLWQWFTFNWIYPLLKKVGLITELHGPIR